MSDYRLAVDVDGTLAASHELVVDFLNKEYGDELPEDERFAFLQISDYDEIGDYFLKAGISPQDFYDILNNKWRESPEEFSFIEDPYNVEQNLRELNKTFETDIVTMNPYPDNIQRWLEENGIEKDKHYGRIISLHDEGIEKTDLDYDFYIDDNPNMVDKMEYHHSLLLYQRPYNLNIKERIGPLVKKIDSIETANEILVTWKNKLDKLEPDSELFKE